MIIWLAVITLVMVLIAGLAIGLAHIAVDGNEHRGFWAGLWSSLLRTLDPGTMGSDQGWPFRAIELSVTIGGILVVTTLIGLVGNGIDRRVERLRKGRSAVVEAGHTLILGWSSKIVTIVSELIVANENVRDAVVVILAPLDKVEMEDELRARIVERGSTRIVCRTGDCASLLDLEIVAPCDAKAVVVLRSEAADADAQVVRTVLALLSGPLEHEPVPIVAELQDSQTARALRNASDGRVTTIVSTEVIARITAQVCHQQGLSAVYQELLDFDGDEIYLTEVSELTGTTYAEALLSFENASVMGIRRTTGEILLAPSSETVFEAGDRVIAIAEDDDRVIYGALENPEIVLAEGADLTVDETSAVEHTLIIGWNDLGPLVLRELDDCMAPGSTVRIVLDPDHSEQRAVRRIAQYAHLDVSVEERDLADGIDVRDGPGPLDHIVLLCYRNAFSPAEADARTLITLLQLRHELEALDGPRPGIVTELLDVHDVALARTGNADDFIVSERLTSLMISQLAESIDLHDVLNLLFEGDDVTLSLLPASRSMHVGAKVRYGQLVAAGIAHGHTVLGYRTQGVAGLPAVLHLNPPKSSELQLTLTDQLVVLERSRSLPEGDELAEVRVSNAP